MNNSRMKRLMSVLAMLAAAMVLAAGCGDDDNDGGGGGGGSDSPNIGDTTPSDTGGGNTDATPDNKDEAIDKCYEEAKKLEGQARETAEAGCKAADTGDTDELKDEAKQQCLEGAKQIPDEAARQQAEENCEKLGG
jgi:hypothetical protein